MYYPHIRVQELMRAQNHRQSVRFAFKYGLVSAAKFRFHPAIIC
jgi:hypothetical protein